MPNPIHIVINKISKDKSTSVNIARPEVITISEIQSFRAWKVNPKEPMNIEGPMTVLTMMPDKSERKATVIIAEDVIDFSNRIGAIKLLND